MNFEAKHLIRLGIPGWLYLAIVLIYFIVERKKGLIEYLSEFNINEIGITVLIAGGGILIGFLIHQFSMLFGFRIWIRQKTYFNNEYELDKIMMRNELGKEIQRIYSHRLGQIHALRGLLTSSILSLITLIPLLIFYSNSPKAIYVLCFNIILVVISFFNHLYFKRNLDFFVRKIRRDYRE